MLLETSRRGRKDAKFGELRKKNLLCVLSVLGGRKIRIHMAGELILIIEDNEKNRKLVRDVLQVKGYKTIETETAEEGIKLAIEQFPALILMDIQLPGMDGMTALKQLRANPQTKSIPVIAITASAMTYKRQTMLAEGFDGYQS